MKATDGADQLERHTTRQLKQRKRQGVAWAEYSVVICDVRRYPTAARIKSITASG